MSLPPKPSQAHTQQDVCNIRINTYKYVCQFHKHTLWHIPKLMCFTAIQNRPQPAGNASPLCWVTAAWNIAVELVSWSARACRTVLRRCLADNDVHLSFSKLNRTVKLQRNVPSYRPAFRRISRIVTPRPAHRQVTCFLFDAPSTNGLRWVVCVKFIVGGSPVGVREWVHCRPWWVHCSGESIKLSSTWCATRSPATNS
jgi:hypothetical protein